MLRLVFGQTGYIAGGFLRDAEAGVEPKDIDLYVEAQGRDQEAIDQFAKAFYGALGYSCNRMGTHEGDDGEYPLYLHVYEAVGCPEDQYPVNLVVTPKDHPHTMEFDVGLCEIYCWYDAHRDSLHISRPSSYKKDVEHKTLTIMRIQDPIFREFEDLEDEAVFNKAFARHVNHLNRLKEKYPEHRVIFCQDFLTSAAGRKAYPLYLEQGLVENPRTLLPTEAERAHWDALRQQDGEAFARDVQRIAERNAADAARQQGINDFFARLGPAGQAGLNLQANARVVRG